ncbi:MAG TPA: sigma-70 family RNA polymerase sigma factor [Acidimicrobiales bacterium]|nr:sigma-70 family RNA polymerase sigma factor [Acidimicrobiales bacterium]
MALGDRFPEVLEAAQQGAAWALADIYRDLHPAVVAFCRVRAGQDAEDLAADVFLAAAQGIRRFVGDEPSFRSWLFTIAYRTTQRHWQRTRRSTPVDPASALWERSVGDAEAEALHDLGTAAALGLIRQLPDAQAEVVALRIVADLPVEEVSRIVGRRPGAVRALQLRALRRLARELPPEEGRNAGGGLPHSHGDDPAPDRPRRS